MADQKQTERMATSAGHGAGEGRMEKLVSLCKRRGFIFPASEIYGGLNGFWDYGPMGVLLKRNVKDAWWHDLVTNPPVGPDGREITMLGLDSAIIQNPRVWEASGHVQGFTDPMVDCRVCNARFRFDTLYGVSIKPSEQNEPQAVVTVLADSAEEACNHVEHNWRAIRRKHSLRDEHVLYAYRWDHEFESFGHSNCPSCGAYASLTEPRKFNMMFESYTGAAKDSASKVYLRPETAQGIFVNYKNVLDTSRVKLPFGIAQIGKAFRNEINPRNYTFRSREFEQMEIEFFCRPDESMRWYEFWRNQRIEWYKSLGLRSDHLRPREQGPDELAHYSEACTDIEYLFPFSDEPQELEGVAHRGCYDLSRHQEFSGREQTYFDDEAWERDRAKFAGDKEAEAKAKAAEPYRFIPHVVEPSAGVDRFALAALCEAYTEDEAPDEKGVMRARTVMKFHPRLAPVKVAVFPLVRKDGMPEIALKLYRRLKARWSADYDDKSAVGRRYRRHDEIGTPFCVTIDGQTKADETVTIRGRDGMEQVRVPLAGVQGWLAERLGM